MPTYEYKCEKCGHEFERDQRITEGPVKKCPSCKASRVKRLISATSFVLKGGGWYSDLYSSGKPKADAASGSDTKPDGGGDKPAKEGDSKPAASTETKKESSETSKPGKSKKGKPAAA
jgi:putative FmdB family regulatory protein